MAIKMRTNNVSNAICCNCGNGQDKSLSMFDLCIGKTIFTICDVCNGQIFNKTLRAECATNSKIRSPHDQQIVAERNARHSPYFGSGKHLSVNEAMKQ